jgi:hypothetical protein
MGLWKTLDNVIWDDMDGAAIGLPSWPEGMIPITEQEAEDIRNAAVEAISPTFPILTPGEFQQGLVNMGFLTKGGILAAAKQAELPYPLKQIVDAAVAGGTPTAAQLQAEPYNLPELMATPVAQAIAGGLTLTAADGEDIAWSWVTMVQVGRDYPLIAQLQMVLGIPDVLMDQLFLTRGQFYG